MKPWYFTRHVIHIASYLIMVSVSNGYTIYYIYVGQYIENLFPGLCPITSCHHNSHCIDTQNGASCRCHIGYFSENDNCITDKLHPLNLPYQKNTRKLIRIEPLRFTLLLL